LGENLFALTLYKDWNKEQRVGRQKTEDRSRSKIELSVFDREDGCGEGEKAAAGNGGRQ